MKLCNTYLLSVTAALAAREVSAQYALKDDYSGHNFFSGFDFFTDKDPTNGFVKYQSFKSSVNSQLAGYLAAEGSMRRRGISGRPNVLTRDRPGNERRQSSNTSTPHVFLGLDYTTTINTTTPGSGRASTRVTSKKTYNQGSLLIADIAHMPAGVCGLWPALWMTGPEWPTNGEIDILENVNDASSNAVTLHTSTGCVVQNKTANAGDDGSFIGTLETSNCDVKAVNQPSNAGCSISMPARTTPSGGKNKASGATFGKDFNLQGGGVYAMEWTSKSINVWFFPYSNSTSSASVAAGSFPSDLLSDKPNPSTASWGAPAASFAGSGCDITSRFRNLSLVANIGLCGDWSGNVWKSGGCAAKTGVSTCEEYVAKNPAAFEEAYWEFRSLKMFGDGKV